jgi:hypothetical protein
MESRSSASVMTGRVIFLTMTVLPDSDAHTSFVLNALAPSKRRLMVATTASASMMAPSTIASAGTGSLANATTRNALPVGFSSTALMALDPMSSPTGLLFRRHSPLPSPCLRLGPRRNRVAGPKALHKAADESVIGRSPRTNI